MQAASVQQRCMMKVIILQCKHMSVILSQTAGDSTVCSKDFQAYNINTSKIKKCRPVDSPHKGPVIWKVFPYHDVIVILHSILAFFWKVLMTSTGQDFLTGLKFNHHISSTREPFHEQPFVYELSLFNSGALKLVELNFPPCAPQ